MDCGRTVVEIREFLLDRAAGTRVLVAEELSVGGPGLDGGLVAGEGLQDLEGLPGAAGGYLVGVVSQRPMSVLSSPRKWLHLWLWQ